MEASFTASAHSSSTGLLPKTSSASSSVTIACPVKNSGEDPKSPTASSGGTSFLHLRHWKWEVAACILILAVPTIIVATIFPHGDQPIPQWPFKISINALLSVYALVFKSAIAYVVTSCVGQLQWAWFSSSSRPLSDVVLFDNAGNSPWGLLTMLWAHRLRQPLTIIAAIIMISGLAIDPFIQQLVRPFDCSIPLDHNVATLPRTNRIDIFYRPGEDQQNPSHTLRPALAAGLSNSGNEVPWECSTGNCTFPEVYSTLGICSSCEDLSAEIVVESTPLEDDSQNITTSLSSGDGFYYWGANHDQLNTTFSNESSIDHRPLEVARMDIWSPSSPDHFTLRIDTMVGKTTHSDARLLISTGQNITGCDAAEARNTWACRGYGAASCTLKPCVRTYRASLEAGHLKERLVSQSPDIKWGYSWEANHFGILDTQCISAQEKAFLTAWGYNLHNTTGWIPFGGIPGRDESTSVEDVPSDWLRNLGSLLHHKCVYLMSVDFMYKVGYADMSGPWLSNPAASQFVGTVQGTSWAPNGLGERLISTFYGPDLLQSIYNYGKVDFERTEDEFRNISESLTTYIRTHGNVSYSEPVRGQVQHYATCLGIQWPWITLPAVLAVLTILFLVLVVESTGRLETPLWKASPLPWILGGGLNIKNGTSPSGSQEPPEDGLTVTRMEDESRQILVTLSEGATPRIGMVHMRDHNLQAIDK